MNRLACFLIPVLICAQADLSWAAVADFLSVPFDPSSDDDEYLTSNRRPQEENGHQKQVILGRKPLTADFWLVRKGMASAWNLTRPFTAPPLYVLASLQI